METELLALGIVFKHSKPYHPQTCGKVERFHQTMKKYLDRQDPPADIAELQGHLDRFVEYYNEVRPHRALGRKTPRSAFEARTKAHPSRPGIVVEGYRVRHDKVDRAGKVTLRYGASCITSASAGPTRAGTSSCWWPAVTYGSSTTRTT